MGSFKVLVVSFFLIFVSLNSAFAMDSKGKKLHGQWGGAGASLFITENGADGGFNCSSGRINQSIVTDENGHFVVQGEMDYWFGTPAPAQHVPATFTGDVNHKQMHLVIQAVGYETWSFDLTKDNQGQTYECLR